MARFACAFLLTSLLVVFGTNAEQFSNVPRGAQARLTLKGLNYGASVGVRKLQQDLTNKRIDAQSGRKNDISYSASNIVINRLNVGSYSVKPSNGNTVKVSMGSISVEARGTIKAKFKKGWFQVGDQTNVVIKANGVGITLNFNVGARNGKPQLGVQSCSSNIGNIDLDFNGGLSWVYNAISSIFEGKLEDILKDVMCEEGTKLINREANDFLKGFPVQQNIENYAYINYAFQKPETTPNYIDFLLRGEFLAPNKPVPSTKTPPSFETTTDASKMAYVWITDYTLNSAGHVFHETGLLKKLIGPLTDKIPDDVKGFLNTKSFEQFIPELFRRYPNRPLEFQVATNKAPTFKISAGKIDVFADVRATVVVNKIDGSKLPVFYLDITVDASGSAFVKTENNQLNVGGNVKDFTFGAKIGGSVLGDINIPLDDPSIKMLVRGLVVDNANTLLNKGFPIPRIDDLSFIDPKVTFVQNAIRIDSDIQYSG